MTERPIADYGFISDCHSAALVSRHGSIDWLCLPRFDSPSIFGALVGSGAGHWALRAAGSLLTTRRYLPRTLVLETTFRTPTGIAVLTDALAAGPKDYGHDLGRSSPHVLLRTLRCTRGQVDVRMELAPRPDYGMAVPLLELIEGGLMVRGNGGILVLSTSVPLEIGQSTARHDGTLKEGEEVALALCYGGPAELPPVRNQQEIAAELRNTVEAWRSWVELHQHYEGPWAELVHTSGRVLQGLTYRPTGAIVAAPTTSLPEEVGGERNWDYRYAWVRDASLTLNALWVAACPHEAGEFFAWMAGAAAAGLQRLQTLQIMFGIADDQDLSERVLPHLTGWRNSQPVRVGNGAWKQRQLDVYGELLDAAFCLVDEIGEMGDETRAFLVAVADTAAERWTEPDQGIWEVRAEPQHFLHSKLMCWVALDRGVRFADRLHATQEHTERWSRVRDEIGEAILTRGWSEHAQAFTQAFGSDALDASALMLALVGFLPATDQRMRATIEAIERHLTDDRGLVYRYRCDDGLPGQEGTFLLCTFWLAQAVALAGEPSRAREVFERAVGYANDLGLLSEEVDGNGAELLGNFPQALSHIGLINAAWAISQAEAESVPEPSRGVSETTSVPS